MHLHDAFGTLTADTRFECMEADDKDENRSALGGGPNQKTQPPRGIQTTRAQPSRNIRHPNKKRRIPKDAPRKALRNVSV
jgi:hypothetical protein